MNQNKALELTKDIATDIIGGILIAVGVYNFAAAAKFPMVGVNGIALIFYQLFGLPIGTVALILNIPIAICCFRLLGRRFFLNSVRTIIITSIIMDVIAPLFPVYQGDRLLSAICCGVLSGLGYAMIYMRDSSTGGSDFIMMSIGTVALILNIPIAICCFRLLGRRFFLNSVRTIIITSIIMDVIAPLFPVYQGDRLLSAICCGVLSGLGYAMIYMRDSSTGGSDFIMMSIKALNPHLSLGNIAFALDAVIVILGTVIVSRDVDSLIYGLIVSYLLSLVMDKVMYGIDEGKLALIVTDPEHSTEICFKIDEVLGRGSTILNGMGSYSKDDKHIIMCACNNKQMYGIRKLIKTIDPKSFLVIMESNDVVGEGFKDE